jgi:hypothetical protein
MLMLTPLERAIRLFIYRHFLDTARAPDVATIAHATGTPAQDVESNLHRLADAHAIVLAPATTAIWMAHPFSAVPTPYPVVARGRTYWANCAWDAVGIFALVDADAETRSRCPDCGAQVRMAVRGGRLEGDGVIHFTVPPPRFWDNIAYT